MSQPVLKDDTNNANNTSHTTSRDRQDTAYGSTPHDQHPNAPRKAGDGSGTLSQSLGTLNEEKNEENAQPGTRSAPSANNNDPGLTQSGQQQPNTSDVVFTTPNFNSTRAEDTSATPAADGSPTSPQSPSANPAPKPHFGGASYEENVQEPAPPSGPTSNQVAPTQSVSGGNNTSMTLTNKKSVDRIPTPPGGQSRPQSSGEIAENAAANGPPPGIKKWKHKFLEGWDRFHGIDPEARHIRNDREPDEITRRNTQQSIGSCDNEAYRSAYPHMHPGNQTFFAKLKAFFTGQGRRKRSTKLDARRADTGARRPQQRLPKRP